MLIVSHVLFLLFFVTVVRGAGTVLFPMSEIGSSLFVSRWVAGFLCRMGWAHSFPKLMSAFRWR
jgi:hypothetical protein